MGNDFWDGLEARNEKKFDSIYDFGNYLTIGSFDTAKSMYQGMEDRAHVAMNSPYDFVNYISMGTLDLGNGAINPEESFSKEHWLSSIGLASILAGGAKPIVRGPKTPSLQDRNLVLDKTIDKAHELTMKTKSHVNYVIGEVRGGIHVLLNEMNDHNNLAYSLNGECIKIPFNVLDTEAVKKVLDGVLSRFSLSGGKGTVEDVKGVSGAVDDIIKDGSHIIKGGKLKPNIKYQAGEYDYLYKTDESGRLTEFNADDLKLTERDNRLPHKSNTPGKEPGDHAGHLAADRFGGSPDLDNLVSQSSSVNLSKYKKLENHWAKAIEEGKDVSVNVQVKYEENSLRPSSFDIEYEIDGRMRFTSIEN
ncbi:DNA/RNA non-specific endonuclease [Metabacillus elymi]|uniref:DNA/RNA non-specific endonuclease n=1 Tax=Metabacillus elymi TaxID=2745198 RepID=UPI0021AB9399|nr:DNA/RNA non-specific endonuclease [Metabacillus sp. KUDC1714]